MLYNYYSLVLESQRFWSGAYIWNVVGTHIKWSPWWISSVMNEGTYTCPWIMMQDRIWVGHWDQSKSMVPIKTQIRSRYHLSPNINLSNGKNRCCSLLLLPLRCFISLPNLSTFFLSLSALQKKKKSSKYIHPPLLFSKNANETQIIIVKEDNSGAFIFSLSCQFLFISVH